MILYQDSHILVAIKPPRVLSTDEPGGFPELLRQELGEPDADIRTVHRLDRVVSGLMVLARTPRAASELSRQVREGKFGKEYLAILHGITPEGGKLWDMLGRDKARKMTFVADSPAKGVQEASLTYTRLNTAENLSRVHIRLQTGRTHQIRVQFSSRGFPLVGERKYAQLEDPCQIALWSHALTFTHPATGAQMTFTADPPGEYPWNIV